MVPCSGRTETTVSPQLQALTPQLAGQLGLSWGGDVTAQMAPPGEGMRMGGSKPQASIIAVPEGPVCPPERSSSPCHPETQRRLGLPSPGLAPGARTQGKPVPRAGPHLSGATGCGAK